MKTSGLNIMQTSCVCSLLKSRLLPQLQYFQSYDNMVNTVLKCVYRYTRGDNVRDCIIFCLFHFDVELCQGNAKSANCIGQFSLHYREVSNMFEVADLVSR